MVGTTALIVTVAEQEQTEDSEHQLQMSGVPIYLIRGEEGVFEALNVPARNEVAHKSPGLLKGIVAKALQRQANIEGSYKGTDIVVHWTGSGIPFHIEFEFSVLNKTCYHLASIRNVKTNGPVSTLLYAFLTSLRKTGPVCTESCSTGKDFLEQITGRSTETAPFDH